MRLARVRFVSGALALLLPLMLAAPLRAAEDIEVRTLNVNVRGSTFALEVRASFPADDKMRQALAAGATINMRLQAVIDEKRHYWFDERVVDVALRRELSWNAVSQRYVLCYELKEAECGRQQTFPTFEEALVAAGVVENWPIVAEAKLDPEATYQFSMRASLRRGGMPSTLRDLTRWTRYWNHRSEWQAWTPRR